MEIGGTKQAERVGAGGSGREVSGRKSGGGG